MPYTIHEIAKLAGVTLWTLRFYDHAGLLHPAKRSEAGYRLYTDEEMLRLQQILFFRELDFPVKKIKEILNNPDFDRKEALGLQIKYLIEKAARYQVLSNLAQKTLENMEEGIEMDQKEIFEGFDIMMAHQKKYEDEVYKRWGQTDAYKISRQRIAKYAKEDWEKISKVQAESANDLAALYKASAAPEDAKTQAVVKRMHKIIHEFFYPCPLKVFEGLGELYIADTRFSAYYDNYAKGLAEYYHKAIQVYMKHAQEL